MVATTSLITPDAVATSSATPVLVIGGKQGTKPSQFNEPDSIYISPIDGRIYAGDTVNLRVQVFEPDGTYITSFTGFTPLEDAAGNEAQGIVELSDGSVVVIEKAGNLTFFDRDTGDIKHITVLSDIVSESQIDTQGLAVDSRNDYIYVTNQPENLVYVIAPNGTLVDKWSVGDFTTPENMVVDTVNDRIFVSAEAKGEIYYFTMNGTFLGNFGKDESSLNFEGLALDPLGNIIAMDEGGETDGAPYTSRFVIYNGSDFTPLYSVGDDKGGTAPGQFLTPDGVAYDFLNNRVFVADQGNFRIQAFDYIDILKTSGIYSDDIAPTVSDFANFNTTAGEQSKISWDITENSKFTGTYVITLDGSEVESGHFASGDSIEYQQVYNASSSVKITVTDAFGNSASDSVLVTIKSGKTTSTSSNDTAPFPFFIVPIAIAVVVIRRKLK